MSKCEQLSALNPEDINPCWGHSGLALNHLYIILGGYELDSSESRTRLDRDYSKIHVFNTHLRKWFLLKTSGEYPGKSMYSTALINGVIIYVVCHALDNSHGPNEIYTLDLTNLKWKKLCPPNLRRPTLRKDFTSWIHDTKLYIFGGHGFLPYLCWRMWPNYEFVENASTYFIEDSSAQSVEHHENQGYNNQLCTFDLNKCQWSTCESSGNIPSPRASHQICVMGDMVILFGGFDRETRLNDLYTFNMKTFVWKRIYTIGALPCGRIFHSLTALSPRKLLMYGGKSAEPLSDMWIVNMDNWEWTEIQKCNVPRMLHSTVLIDNVIYIYGGRETFYPQHHPTHGSVNDLLEVKMGVSSLQNLCHRVISSESQFFPPHEITAKLPKSQSLRIFAARGNCINSSEEPLIELMKY